MAMFGPLGGMLGLSGGGKKPGGFGSLDPKMDRKRSMMADALDRPDFGPSPQAGGMPKVASRPMMPPQPQAPMPAQQTLSAALGRDVGAPPAQQTLSGALGRDVGMAQPSPSMDRNIAMMRANAPQGTAPQPTTGMPVRSRNPKASGVRGPSAPAGAVPTAFGGLTGYK